MVRASFYGLEIGKSALVMSQLGLDVTGHNIANVDTKGYTRQRIIGTAYDPFATIGRALPVSQALIGGGVKVLIHDQIRSAYLDSRYRAQNSLNSYWQRRTENLSYLEAFFDNVNEETSINFSIARFFAAVKVLADDSVKGESRKLLQTAGLDLVQELNTIYEGLIGLQESQNVAIKFTVEEINRIAEELVDLNKEIYGFEVTGNFALDLRDKRNLLLDELSSIIPIEYREYPDGRGQSLLEVKIGGKVLVDHNKQYELDTREVPNVIPGEAPSLEVVWKPRMEPDTGPGAEYRINLSLGDRKVSLKLDAGVDVTDLGVVTWTVDRLNELADLFSKLNVQFDDSASPKIAAAITTPPTLPNVADYGGDPLDPDYLAAMAEYDDALLEYNAAQTDYNDALAYISEMQSYLGPGVAISVDCEQGGTHAFITIKDRVFARSAGCVDSNLPTYSIGFDPPEKLGDYVPLDITGGELLAFVQMRDSLDKHTPGIPYYIEMLNNLARALVQEINGVHRDGWTEDVDRSPSITYSDGTVIGNGSVTGVDFFWTSDFEDRLDGIVGAINSFLDGAPLPASLSPGDPGYDDMYASLFKIDGMMDILNDILADIDTAALLPTYRIDPSDPLDPYYSQVLGVAIAQVVNLVTAKNICLSQAVMDSEYNIACSTEMIVKHGIPEDLQRGNNENTNLLYKLFEKNDISILFGADIGSFDGYATSIRFDLGNTLSYAKKTADNFNTLIIAAENQRQAVSGVSLDEEMTELIKYQHAYNGAARVITAMDEALDKLINGTGRVGL